MSTKPTKTGTIGATVRALREIRDLTQADLAKAAECHQPDISDLEHDRHEPSISLLRRIAKALGVSVSVILADSAE